MLLHDGWTHDGSEKSHSVDLIVRVPCKTSGHGCMCEVKSFSGDWKLWFHVMASGKAIVAFPEFGTCLVRLVALHHFCTRKDRGW